MDPIEQLNQDTELEHEFRFALKSIIGISPGKKNVERLNQYFLGLLIQIKNKIRHRLPFEKKEKYFDLMQINCSYDHRDPNLPIYTDEALVDLTSDGSGSTNQNIILIGMVRASKRIWEPIRMSCLNEEIAKINKILFVYPEYHILFTYITHVAYDPSICIKEGIMRVSNLKPLEYIVHGRLGMMIQFGYKNDPKRIVNEITCKAIKTMWILHTKIGYIIDIYNKCKINEFLPGFFNILCKRADQININRKDLTNYLHTGYIMLPEEYLFFSDLVHFYARNTKPQRILIEVSVILMEWKQTNCLSETSIRKAEKIMTNIGDIFDPRHIIETICCMEYLGGAFRDIIQMMFEIMLVV